MTPKSVTTHRSCITRITSAYTNCQLKKEKCTGSIICKKCKQHNHECEYKLSKKRGPKPKSYITPALSNLLNPYPS